MINFEKAVLLKSLINTNNDIEQARLDSHVNTRFAVRLSHREMSFADQKDCFEQLFETRDSFYLSDDFDQFCNDFDLSYSYDQKGFMNELLHDLKALDIKEIECDSFVSTVSAVSEAQATKYANAVYIQFCDMLLICYR